LPGLPETTGFDDLKKSGRVSSDSRTFSPHQGFWIMWGPKIAQLALAFGADDIDGTVIEERITHMAGRRRPRGSPARNCTT